MGIEHLQVVFQERLHKEPVAHVLAAFLYVHQVLENREVYIEPGARITGAQADCHSVAEKVPAKSLHRERVTVGLVDIANKDVQRIVLGVRLDKRKRRTSIGMPLRNHLVRFNREKRIQKPALLHRIRRRLFHLHGTRIGDLDSHGRRIRNRLTRNRLRHHLSQDRRHCKTNRNKNSPHIHEFSFLSCQCVPLYYTPVRNFN